MSWNSLELTTGWLVSLGTSTFYIIGVRCPHSISIFYNYFN